MANFYDLNFLKTNVKLLGESLLKAHKLGYDIVAINEYAQEGSKDLGNLRPTPPIKLQTQPGRKPLQQLSRVTLVCSMGGQGFKRQDILNRFNIIAIQPTTEASFKWACLNHQIDLITFDLTQKLPFYFKHSPIKAAVDSGKYFEIQYTPAIRDSTIRKHFFGQALALCKQAKGRNIIISSQVENPMELRGPYDVANLGMLFGLTEAQSKAAISTTCRSVIIHGATRTSTIKSSMMVMKASDLKEENQWRIQERAEVEPSKKKKKKKNKKKRQFEAESETIESSEKKMKTS